jgi:exopolysaccharide biosynthesis WecB/TagA/CpsF family protein
MEADMTELMSSDAILNQLTLLDDTGYERMLHQLSQTRDGVVVGFLNQHGYNLIEQQPHLLKPFQSMDYLLRDGIGIKLACQLNGIDPGLNLNGTDFIPKLLAKLRASSTQPIEYFAMGTQEPWLSQGAAALFDSSEVHTIDGFQDNQAYVDFFNANHTPEHLSVVVLAMGMPKQERVAQMLMERPSGATVIICGGAIIDFAANRVDRAPLWMRKTGMEWMYRLCKEPRRLFRRYIIGIPLFFLYVLRNRK